MRALARVSKKFVNSVLSQEKNLKNLIDVTISLPVMPAFPIDGGYFEVENSRYTVTSASETSVEVEAILVFKKAYSPDKKIPMKVKITSFDQKNWTALQTASYKLGLTA